jgi:hypothetical protein
VPVTDYAGIAVTARGKEINLITHPNCEFVPGASLDWHLWIEGRNFKFLSSSYIVDKDFTQQIEIYDETSTIFECQSDNE